MGKRAREETFENDIRIKTKQRQKKFLGILKTMNTEELIKCLHKNGFQGNYENIRLQEFNGETFFDEEIDKWSKFVLFGFNVKQAFDLFLTRTVILNNI